MKPNKMQISILILLFYYTLNEEIEIKNFVNYYCDDQTLTFVYHYQPNNSSDNNYIPYFFFGVNSYSGSNRLLIYEENKQKYDAEMELRDENKLFGYKIKNNTAQKYTFKISTSWSLSFIFIDNTREIETNLNSFLSFKFETYTSYEGISFQLIFKINPDLKSVVEFNYDKNNYYNSNYLLEYCKINQNQCEYKGINMTAIFEKGEKYKIKYNCYTYYRSEFDFAFFSSISIHELHSYDIASFYISSSHKEQYFLMNIKNYNNFSIYIDKSYLYAKYMNEINIEDIDMITNYTNEYKKYSTTNGIANFNNIGNEYLAIKIGSFDYYSGILGLIPEIHDLVEDNIIEIENGKKAVIRYSHRSGTYILVSSNKNIKILGTSFFSLYFEYEIVDTYFKNNLVYVDSSNQNSKIKLFRVQFNYHYNTNLKLYTNNDINNELGKADSLFLRMSSYTRQFLFNVFYFYGLKEKYYLYIRKHYGNIDFYRYNKELNEY